jgi:hypothetical protein
VDEVAGQVKNNGRRLLSAAITEYLSDVKLTKKPKTHVAYAGGLEYFQESCHKMYVEDVERRDLLKFAAFLRDEKDQAPRSCHNKFRYASGGSGRAMPRVCCRSSNGAQAQAWLRDRLGSQPDTAVTTNTRSQYIE